MCYKIRHTYERRLFKYMKIETIFPPMFIIAQGAFELRDLQYLYVRIQNYTGVLLLLENR